MATPPSLEGTLDLLQRALKAAVIGQDTAHTQMDCLFDLETSLGTLSKAHVEKEQAQIEKVLSGVLATATAAPTQRLVASCYRTLYSRGDPRKNQVTMKFLSECLAKSGSTSYPYRIGALRCLEYMAAALGPLQPSLISETISHALRQIKSSEATVRVAAVDALRGAMKGSGSANAFNPSEVSKVLAKTATDKAVEVCLATARCVAELARWTINITGGLNAVASVCLKGMDEDAPEHIHKSFAETLGSILALAAPEPGEKPRPREKKKKNVDLMTAGYDGLLSYLANAFTRSVTMEGRLSLAHAYVAFLKNQSSKQVEGHILLIIRHLLSLLTGGKVFASQADTLTTRVCVVHVLCALAETLGELGLQLAVRELLECHHKAETNDSVVVCIVDVLRTYVSLLGEGCETVVEQLKECLVKNLSHASPPIRAYAAAALRELAVAIPSQLSSLLEGGLNLVQVDHADLDVCTPFEVNKCIERLNGHTIALAGLVIVISQFPMAVSYTVPLTALNLASTLLGPPQEQGNPSRQVAIERSDAGWILVEALMSLGPEWVGTKLTSFVHLWRDVLNRAQTSTTGEKELFDEFRRRRGAHASLRAFVTICSSLLTPVVMKYVFHFLGNSVLIHNLQLDGLTSIVRDEIDGVRMEMFNTATALAATNNLNSRNIITVFSMAVNELGENGCGAVTSLLPSVLNQGDNFLENADDGIGVESLEEVLDALMSDSIDGSYLHSALRTPNGIKVRRSHAQPLLSHPLAVRLVDSAVCLFSTMFPVMTDSVRLKLLEDFLGMVKPPKGKVVRMSVLYNITAALLAGLRELMFRRGPDEGVLGSKKNYVAMRDIFLCVIQQRDIKLRRAGGEGLGMIARGDEGFMRSVFSWADKKIKQQLAQNKNEPESVIFKICYCTFVLGCLHRSVGGMKSHPHLEATVRSIHRMVQDEKNPEVAKYATHALHLTIESTGVYYGPHVFTTLSLMYTLFSQETYPDVETLCCMGRAVNGLISAIAPELESDHGYVNRSLAICEELKVCSHPFVQAQAILILQQLVLFAPRTVDSSSFLPYLREWLASKDVYVRRAAMICLREMVPKAVDAFRSEKLEELLLKMLDTETDGTLIREIRTTLLLLAEVLAPENPVEWLNLCRAVMVTTQPASPSKGDVNDAHHEIEDEGDEGRAAVGSGQGFAGGSRTETKAPTSRWHTKVFAVQCFRQMLKVLSKKKEHFDLELARTASEAEKKDFLVYHLGDLVTFAFNAATATMNTLRKGGLEIMQDIFFAAARDPDYQGHALLEQYQAQVSACLRSAFSPDSPPEVTTEACSCAALFLERNVSSDPVTLKRVLGLITNRLESLTGQRRKTMASEQSDSFIQLTLLDCLAKIHLAAQKQSQGVLASLIRPHLPLLCGYWIDFLRDHTAIKSYPHVVHKVQGGTFFTLPTVPHVLPVYEAAWPIVLKATTTLIGSDAWHTFRGEEDEAPYLHLLVGKCVHTISSTGCSEDTIIKCLEALARILDPAYLTDDIISSALCVEILYALGEILETAELALQITVMEFVHKLSHAVTRDYLDGGPSSLLVHAFLEVNAQALHRQISGLHHPPNPGDPTVQLVEDQMSVLHIALSSVATLGGKCAPATRLHFIPSVLHLLFRILYFVDHTNAMTILQDLKAIIQATGSLDGQDTNFWSQWGTVLRGLLVEVLHGIEEDESGTRTPRFLFALAIICGDLPEQGSEGGGLYHRCVACLRSILQTGPVQSVVVCMQVLRSILQTLSQAPDRAELRRIVNVLFHELGVDVVMLLHRGSRDDPRAADPNMLIEAMRVMLVLYSFVTEEQRMVMLSLILPSFITLLQPTIPQATYQFAIQALLGLAQSAGPMFREGLQTLPGELRQLLEVAIRASTSDAQQRQQQETSKQPSMAPSKHTIQLKTDFGNFK